MIDRPTGRHQPDLLVRAANALNPDRVTPQVRSEVASLLKLLLAEHIAAAVALPPEATDD